MAELDDVPPDELAELLDMLVWNGPGSDRERVVRWRAELTARADRDAPPVRLAADICMHYLAEPGSPFERRIHARIASGLDGGADRPPLLQDN